MGASVAIQCELLARVVLPKDLIRIGVLPNDFAQIPDQTHPKRAASFHQFSSYNLDILSHFWDFRMGSKSKQPHFF